MGNTIEQQTINNNCNITNNSITNNITNHKNIHVHINAFGSENIEYLLESNILQNLITNRDTIKNMIE